MSTPEIDPRTFRNVLGQFCTGITIITTTHEDVPVGFACQSFAALSLEPPLVLFCPTKQSRSWAAIAASGKFCVNVLAEDQRESRPDSDHESPISSPELTGVHQVSVHRSSMVRWRISIAKSQTSTTAGTTGWSSDPSRSSQNAR